MKPLLGCSLQANVIVCAPGRSSIELVAYAQELASPRLWSRLSRLPVVCGVEFAASRDGAGGHLRKDRVTESIRAVRCGSASSQTSVECSSTVIAST